MLVLTRQKNQSIVINGNIIVTVTQIRGGRIKLGIEAPATIDVRRSELEPKNKDA